MILVDSSVWVDFFSTSPASAGRELRRMIQDSEPCGLAGVVISEVLQGLTRNVAPIERFLRQWDILEPSGFETYRFAAELYRRGRVKGISLTTIDTLIAAIAIENNATLFTLDHDFSRIALITGLQLYRF